MMSLSSIMPIATSISSRVTVTPSTAIATSAYSQTPTETTLYNQISPRLLSMPTAVIHYDAPSVMHQAAINCYLDVLYYQQQQALSA
ncbi:MAG: hypothetical protein GY919_01480 [Photobacterium aquimaris]|nr:hypothetical protein [Photobacterium aquimaris]